MFLKQAMLGTANSGEPALDPALSPLLASSSIEPRERRFLLSAAITAIYERAGYLPVRPEKELPSAPDDIQPPCSNVGAELMIRMLQGEHTELIPELCERIKAVGQRLPYRILPSVLKANKEYRRVILPILGERGRWLAQFREEWQWALTPLNVSNEEIAQKWEEISDHEERLSLLKQLRASDPAMARQLIAKVWNEEKAETRHDLILVLEDNLGSDDEAFLEEKLSDRSSSVKLTAAKLLSTIPQSKLQQRMQERTDMMVSYQPQKSGMIESLIKKLKKSNDTAFTIQPPEELDKSWEKDGIIAKPKDKSVGRRAWWLWQVVGLVHSVYWRQRGLNPQQLSELTRSDEWQIAFMSGLSDAVMIHNTADWAASLWDFWFGYKVSKDDHYEAEQRKYFMCQLFSLMNIAEKEARVWHFFDKNPGFFPDLAIILDNDPEFWQKFGRIYLQKLADNGDVLQSSYAWQQSLQIAAKNLPYAEFDLALQIQEQFRKTDESKQKYGYRYYDQFIEVIQLRKQITEGIA